MSNELEDNALGYGPIILLELDNKLKSTTLLKIGTAENLAELIDFYMGVYPMNLFGDQSQLIQLDLSDPIWKLSYAKQQAVASYILTHTLSSRTYRLAFAVANDQKEDAIATLYDMIKSELTGR